MKRVLSNLIFGFAILFIAACGQKGPLEVEQPTLEQPTEPEEELAPVK